MKAEAEKYAEADKKEREIVDTVNKGDQIIFSQEKMIEEQKDNITSDEKSKLEGLLNALRDAVKDKNVEKINELETSINETWNGISQRIYSSQQTNTNESTTSNASTENADDVQDADFEEIKN
jgi:molecular chaperone DnaK